jgi:hypothetical protein
MRGKHFGLSGVGSGYQYAGYARGLSGLDIRADVTDHACARGRHPEFGEGRDEQARRGFAAPATGVGRVRAESQRIERAEQPLSCGGPRARPNRRSVRPRSRTDCSVIDVLSGYGAPLAGEGSRSCRRPHPRNRLCLPCGHFISAICSRWCPHCALRRACPTHRLVLAAPAGLAPIAELIGGIGEVWPPGEDLLWPVAPPGADIAVNLHGQWQEGLHERDRWCALLRAHGIHAAPGDLRLRPPGASGRPGAVVLNPGATYGSRRWPCHASRRSRQSWPRPATTAW